MWSLHKAMSSVRNGTSDLKISGPLPYQQATRSHGHGGIMLIKLGCLSAALFYQVKSSFICGTERVKAVKVSLYRYVCFLVLCSSVLWSSVYASRPAVFIRCYLSADKNIYWVRTFIGNFTLKPNTNEMCPHKVKRCQFWWGLCEYFAECRSPPTQSKTLPTLGVYDSILQSVDFVDRGTSTGV